MPRNVVDLWRVGFGTVQNNNLIKLKLRMMKAVLVANSPQLVLSYLYIAFNSIYMDGESEGVRHCTFSSGPVEFPVVGQLYK